MASFKEKAMKAMDTEDIDSVGDELLKASMFSWMSDSNRGDFMEMMSQCALGEAVAPSVLMRRNR